MYKSNKNSQTFNFNCAHSNRPTNLYRMSFLSNFSTSYMLNSTFKMATTIHEKNVLKPDSVDLSRYNGEKKIGEAAALLMPQHTHTHTYTWYSAGSVRSAHTIHASNVIARHRLCQLLRVRWCFASRAH